MSKPTIQLRIRLNRDVELESMSINEDNIKLEHLVREISAQQLMLRQLEQRHTGLLQRIQTLDAKIATYQAHEMPDEVYGLMRQRLTAKDALEEVTENYQQTKDRFKAQEEYYALCLSRHHQNVLVCQQHRTVMRARQHNILSAQSAIREIKATGKQYLQLADKRAKAKGQYFIHLAKNLKYTLRIEHQRIGSTKESILCALEKTLNIQPLQKLQEHRNIFTQLLNKLRAIFGRPAIAPKSVQFLRGAQQRLLTMFYQPAEAKDKTSNTVAITPINNLSYSDAITIKPRTKRHK